MISLTLKLAILTFGFYLLIRLAKRALRRWLQGFLGAEPQKTTLGAELRPCAHCGVYLDPQLGLTKKGKFYCSPDCARKGPSAPGA